MPYLGTPPQSGFITSDSEKITGQTTNYVNLSNAISSLDDVQVHVNYVIQDPSTLTFTSTTRIGLGDTLVSSDVVLITYLGKSVATQSPPVGGVSNDMLAGSITDAKITGLSSSKLSGVVPTANLGSGTASSSTVLYGDGTFKAEPGGGLIKLAQAKGTSAVTNIVHDSIFSTTYDFYKIIGYTNASAVDGNLRFRWRSGGSEVNGSYYRGVGQGVNLDSGGSESHTVNLARYNDSRFDLTDTTNNNNNFGDFFEITVAGMLDRDEGLIATLRASINQFRSNSNYRQYQYGGFYANQGANEDYDGFMLWYSNANVQYYSYAVYGIIK